MKRRILKDKYGTPLKEDIYVYLHALGEKNAVLVYAKPNENGTITITQHCGRDYGIVSCDVTGKASKFLVPLRESILHSDPLYRENMRFMLSKLEKL